MMYLFVKSLLLPPGLLLLGAAFCWLAWERFPRLARGLFGAEIVLLYLLSTDFVASRAARWLEPEGALVPGAVQAFAPEAIVVLGAARVKSAPEFGGRDTVGPDLLVRLRYAAQVQSETGLPILVTGGPGYERREPEAELMARTLREALGAEVQWLERDSLTTWENAAYSERLLRDAGIERIVLVTQAFHMRRAQASFERVGIAALPAPTGFSGHRGGTLSYRDFLPSMAALALNTRLLHEVLGIAYYRWRFFSGVGRGALAPGE